MRRILDNINDLLEMGVGQTTRLKIIKKTIQAKKPLWSADVQYVELLSRSYLQNKKKSSVSNDKKIIIGTVLALGLFFVFFIVPLPDNNSTPEESTQFDSPPVGISTTPAEVSPNPERSLSANTEFSSASVIQSSSSTQT